MSITMGFFVFLNAWWVMLFVSLPLGIEKADGSAVLDYAAAPKKIRWKKIFLVNTALAFCFTVALALIIHSGMIRFQ
jgi:predicted secreted protein